MREDLDLLAEEAIDLLEAEADELEASAPLKPPGRCAPARHQTLQRLVDRLCHGRPGWERGMTGCKRLSQVGRSAIACATARFNVNKECFDGGNPGHRQAYQDAVTTARNARREFRRLDCARKSGLPQFFD